MEIINNSIKGNFTRRHSLNYTSFHKSYFLTCDLKLKEVSDFMRFFRSKCPNETLDTTKGARGAPRKRQVAGPFIRLGLVFYHFLN